MRYLALYTNDDGEQRAAVVEDADDALDGDLTSVTAVEFMERCSLEGDYNAGGPLFLMELPPLHFPTPVVYGDQEEELAMQFVSFA